MATTAAVAFVIDTTRITTYILNGSMLETRLLWGLFIFIPASFLGALIAKKIVDHIPEKKFRIVISLFLFLIGLRLLI